MGGFGSPGHRKKHVVNSTKDHAPIPGDHDEDSVIVMDSNGLPVKDSGIPISSLLTGMKPCGPWDCSTHAYPLLASIGDFYWASVEGIIEGVDYQQNDWLVYVEDGTWKKIDNTESGFTWKSPDLDLLGYAPTPAEFVSWANGDRGMAIGNTGRLYLCWKTMNFEGLVKVYYIRLAQALQTEEDVFLAGETPTAADVASWGDSSRGHGITPLKKIYYITKYSSPIGMKYIRIDRTSVMKPDKILTGTYPVISDFGDWEEGDRGIAVNAAERSFFCWLLVTDDLPPTRLIQFVALDDAIWKPDAMLVGEYPIFADVLYWENNSKAFGIGTTGRMFLVERYNDEIFFTEMSYNGVKEVTIIKGYSNTPPVVTPTEGDIYVIAETPTGVWIGHKGFFAVWVDGNWEYISPRVGYLFVDVIDGNQIAYCREIVLGVPAWSHVDGMMTHSALNGLNWSASGHVLDWLTTNNFVFKGLAESVLTAPPVTPTNGAYYLIASGATGIWAGKGGQIAYYDSAWTYSIPLATDIWASKAEGNYYLTKGATSWALLWTLISYNNLQNIPLTFTPAAHNQGAETITSGTFDGDRLPALSTAKKGGVPATGTPSGKYLKDDSTWAIPSGVDTNAIHKATEAEISAMTAKSPLVGADVIVIEDSETTPTAYAKKKSLLSVLRSYIAGASFARWRLNIWSTTSATFNSSTTYATIGGEPNTTTTEANTQIAMPKCRVNAINLLVNGTGAEFTITIRKNGVSTTLTGTTTGNGRYNFTGAGPIDFALNDLLSIFLNSGGSPSRTVRGICLCVDSEVI